MEGGAGGGHVVDDEQAQAGDRGRGDEGVAEVLPAGGGVLAGLGGGGADAAEPAGAGSLAGGQGPAGQQGGLVVAAEQGPPGVERDGDDGVPVYAATRRLRSTKIS